MKNRFKDLTKVKQLSTSKLFSYYDAGLVPEVRRRPKQKATLELLKENSVKKEGSNVENKKEGK